MRRILLIIPVLLLLAGCGMTSKVVSEVEEAPTIGDRDQVKLEQALAEKDASVCNYIQTQDKREECFVSVAKELNDPSICNNLLKPLRNSCKEAVIRSIN